jgi:hypothetical protein
MNFGVSQSRAGEDVEKHRDSWKAAKGDDRQVGRRKAIWGPASIFI